MKVHVVSKWGGVGLVACPNTQLAPMGNALLLISENWKCFQEYSSKLSFEMTLLGRYRSKPLFLITGMRSRDIFGRLRLRLRLLRGSIPAPAPAPSKSVWRLQLRLRLQAKCNGYGDSGSGSGSDDQVLI